MSLILSGVPLVAQSTSNTCWYASACMVAYFFEAGPRLGIPEYLAKNKAVTPHEFITLAKNEGLETCNTATIWTEDKLSGLLSKSGPVWCAGYWYGPGHVIALYGASGGHVFFNDPNGGISKKETISWFNKKLAKSVQGCMMIRRTTMSFRPSTGWHDAPTGLHLRAR